MNSDGSLTLTLATEAGDVSVTSEAGALAALVAARGGALELGGKDSASQTHAVRLYMVIAANTNESTADLVWTDPSVRFATFLSGTLSRTSETQGVSTTSPIQLLPQPVLQVIHGLLKFQPDWAELVRRVKQANLHLMPLKHTMNAETKEWSTFRAPMKEDDNASSDGGAQSGRVVTPELLVHEYRNFLSLKVEEEDWTSDSLSPSMFSAPNDMKLVDEVCRV